MNCLWIALLGSNGETNTFFKAAYNAVNYISLFVSITVFSSVYGDEFRNLTLAGIIGTGLTREKFVAAKMIVSALLSLIMFAVLYGSAMLTAFIAVPEATPYETYLLTFNYVNNIAGTVITVSLASIFIFATGSAPVSTFFLIIIIMIGGALRLINETVAWFVDNFYYTGILEQSWSSFVIDSAGEAVWLMIVCLAVYLAVSFGAVMLIFRKKELDF